MKLGEFGVGIITSQNATKDAPQGSEYSNVKKLGLGSGKPKIHDKKATKNSDPNTLFNLGIAEANTSSVDEKEIEKMIRASAKQRGIDPDVAVKVWRSEGGTAYQSRIKRDGKGSSGGYEASYGPFQLYTGGGLGNEYQDRYGVDLSKDNTPDGIKRQIDFSLDKANEKGWKPWYGAANVGVKPYQGIGDKPPRYEPIQEPKKPTKTNNPFGVKARKVSTVDNSNTNDQSFASAFATARKRAGGAGGKFTWQGKEYQTNIKGEKYVSNPVSVDESLQELKIEKPDPKDTLGVKRKDMPQVKSDDYAEFVEYLKSNGATFTKETIPARDLKAMQKEFSDEGIMKQLMKNIEQGPNRKAVIASSDDYIMDGHHRWLVAVNTGADLNVFRVNLPAYELYDLVNKFEKTYYKDIYSERVSIGVPFASGLVMSLFPHRPLKIKKSTPGKLNYNEDITQSDIDQLETFADKLFAKVGIDVEFTRHFLDRVNDERNKKPITMAELTRLFKQEFKRYGKPIAQMGPGQEAVMKDLQTDINLPFALQYDRANNELDLIAKTVMRKKDFKTPDREFPVEGWSKKYKDSINCSNPKGFSQKAHCAGKKKNEDDSLGSQINFPGYDKKEKKPKYKPVAKKDSSVLDKVKGWFTDDINEGYVLRLENDEDLLVLHIRNTRTGERAEVRGNPNYEIDYDENDELHQLLDVIGKASNISELMNGEIVNVNPKHPDGPKSYAAIEKIMGEGAEITMWTNPEYQGADVDDKYYNKQPAKLIDVNKLTPFEPADKMDDEISAANMNKLVKAIKAGEKINPVVVVPHKGKLLIIDGHHRYFAHIKAGVDKIPVVMADPKDLTWRDDVPVQEAQVDEGVNDPHIFKAVFLAGGPGSGKSFVARNILGGTGLKTMNSDDVYEVLMKKKDLALDPNTIASPQGQQIRDKAKMMTKRRSANWIDGRLGLLIDGTGKDVAKYQKQAEFLRSLGYDVAMIFVNTSEEVAQQRNRQRARSLKPEMVSSMWNDVQQNLMKFQQIMGAGRFHIIDNSGGLEDLDRQKNFDKVYNEIQRFLNTPPSKPKAKQWIQQQKEQNDEKRSATQPTNNQSNGGTPASN